MVACGGAPDAEPAPSPEASAEANPTPPNAPPDVAPPSTPPGAPPAPPPVAPDVHAIPWQTSASIGSGVAFKDTKNPLGENVFIGYAGYEVTLASAEAWVATLYDAALAKRGVRWLYAVKGPQDPGYDAQEIGNSHIASALVSGQISSKTNVVIVAGHSSGSFVADELLEQLATGADPAGLTANKIVFFDLDGGQKYVSDAALARLAKHWYVGAHDGATLSPNHGDMQTFASAHGTFFDYDASASGCDAGATWCVHVSLVITKPHDPSTGDPLTDYSDFTGRPVNHAWLDLLK
ncbi:MAG TPA: hypothetical protein VIF62_23075 [Labilithrix sp.]